MRWAPAWVRALVVGYPLVFLLLLFAVPMVLLVALSFYRNIPGGSYEPAFTLENYARSLRPLYVKRLGFTVGISGLTALTCLVLAFPYTYYVARMASPRVRKLALWLAVSTLWLTYVVRAFGWSVLLSRSSGIGQLFAWLGLVEIPPSYTPGFAATLIGFVYVYLPFMIFSLYGTMQSIHRELEEASMNLGANRFATLRHVVLPLARPGMVAGSVLVFLLAMGTYVVPAILGRPQEWTLPVLITDQVAYESNIPFGAALSMVLAVIIGILLGLAGRLLGGSGVLVRRG